MFSFRIFLIESSASVNLHKQKRVRAWRTRTWRLHDAPRGLKDLVKLLLERCGFTEGPVGLLLMAEDDVVEDRLGHAEQSRHLGVNLAALCRDCVPLGDQEQ